MRRPASQGLAGRSRRRDHRRLVGDASGQSVQQIVNSGMPILEREPLGLCTTVAPMPFLAAVLLDRDAVRDLLRVFPMSIRQVGTNQMTMAQMAVKGIKDEGTPNLERIDAFKSTLGLILDFAAVSGVDLTAPLQGNSVDGTGTSPWGVGVFVDAWLPALIPQSDMVEIRQIMDRSRDIDGARRRLADVMPEFLGLVKQSILVRGIQGVYTADVDPETQASVVRPLLETDELNNRWLYWPAEALMDLPMTTSIRYHTHLAEVARVMDLVMARQQEGIATMSQWVDEYAERLPIAPAFNTFYRVNAVMMNSSWVARLDNDAPDIMPQGLAARLQGLRRVVIGTSLLDGLGHSSIEGVSHVEREVSVGSGHDAFIVANDPLAVIDRDGVAAAVNRLSSLPASVFETAAVLELAALSFDWQGAVVVPCGEPINGKLVVAVRNMGHGQIYGRDERSRFELKLDSEDMVGVYNEIRQLVVFPPGTSQVDIGKVLRLAESTSIENGHEVSGVLGILASVVDIQSSISRRNGIHCDVSVVPFRENTYRIAEDWRVIISDEGVPGLIARNLGGRDDTSIGIVNERLETLLADRDGLLQRRLRDNLMTLGISEPQDRVRLYSELVDALLGDNDRRCEAAVSLLSMVSHRSILMINRANRVTRATVVGRVSDGISVIVVGNGPIKVGQLGRIEMGHDAVSTTESETHSMSELELEDVGGDLNDSGLIPLDLTPILVGLEVPSAENRSVDYDGATVRSPSPQVPLNRIGTVGNTCWLETIVNIEALQLNDALRLGGTQFPPITRMILDGLSTVRPTAVQVGDQPKFAWMVSYLDFLGKVTGYGTTDNSIQDIRALAEGWAQAFGEPVGVFQESDSIATSVYNAISRYASKTGASVVTVGLYSHPFGSVEAVRARLEETETRVSPYPGVPNVVIRVRPTESAAILANGVFEMAVQPESLYFDNNPVVASEGLGLPPSDVYRIRESKLVISSHPSQMPATLQFRFAHAGSLSSFLDPSKFNPHRVGGALVFRQSNALYAVSSILGNGHAHWVTLFADTVLPVGDRTPVFYEKLYNGENARIVPDMSWVKAVDQYFRRYPSVVVRASLVPEDHPLHFQAVGRGVLEMPAEERMLRGSVAMMMPEADHVESPPTASLPTTWVKFREQVSEVYQKFGEGKWA
ncbi:hypothetical protein EBR57_01825 [bacterium]|nr:hypothetical protein [bacterium]